MKSLMGGEIGYKKWNQNISFVDMALSSSIEKNRNLKTIEKINRVIDWTKVAVGREGGVVEGLLRDWHRGKGQEI